MILSIQIAVGIALGVGIVAFFAWVCYKIDSLVKKREHKRRMESWGYQGGG